MTSIIFCVCLCLLGLAVTIQGQCQTCASKSPQFFSFGNSQYAFVECPLLSWADARQRCSQLLAGASDLLVIDSLVEKKFISDTLRLLYGADNFGWWIGLNHHNSNKWHWLDNPEAAKQFSWAQGQPNGNTVVRGRQIPDSPCAELIDNDNWNDYDCTFPLRYICEGPAGSSGPVFGAPELFSQTIAASEDSS